MLCPNCHADIDDRTDDNYNKDRTAIICPDCKLSLNVLKEETPFTRLVCVPNDSDVMAIHSLFLEKAGSLTDAEREYFLSYFERITNRPVLLKTK